MWSIMPDGSRYFSNEKIASNRGVWSKTPPRIQGTRGGREFELPFDLKGARPESVTVEVHVAFLPGKGTVELRGITVSEGTSSATATVDGEWFNVRTGVYFNSFGGGFWGCYGALFGCLAGFLVPRGKGRRLLMGMIILAVLAGIVHLTVGMTALLVGQPYHVWYGFMLLGVILLFVFPGVSWGIRRAYIQAEQRRMQALDA
jgi:hypothetical protein